MQIAVCLACALFGFILGILFSREALREAYVKFQEAQKRWDAATEAYQKALNTIELCRTENEQSRASVQRTLEICRTDTERNKMAMKAYNEILTILQRHPEIFTKDQLDQLHPLGK